MMSSPGGSQEQYRPADAGRSPMPHDPRLEWPIPDDAIRVVFDAMLRDGSWGRYHGPHCDALRSALSSFFEVEQVHLCSSGTAAVELALRAVPVGTGDEVILCAYDFQSNFRNVHAAGAQPILVDCERERPVMDIEQIASAVTNATRAIIVSHLHGCLVDVAGVRAVVGDRPIAIIEDACQVPGAMINGRRAGSLGDVGVLSFGGSKLLTAGRGGAVLTSDVQRLQRIVLHTQRGNDVSPLSEMQAAVLLPQLAQLDERNRRRAEGVAALQQVFASAGPFGFRPVIADRGIDVSAWYKVAVELDALLSAGRGDVAARAAAAGVLFDAAFPALHRIHGRSRFRAIGELPNASRFHESLMVLHHTHLLSTAAPAAETARRIVELCQAVGP